MTSNGMCRIAHGANTELSYTPLAWWPESLNLDMLHQHDALTNPMGPSVKYREEFRKFDFMS